MGVRDCPAIPAKPPMTSWCGRRPRAAAERRRVVIGRQTNRIGRPHSGNCNRVGSRQATAICSSAGVLIPGARTQTALIERLNGAAGFAPRKADVQPMDFARQAQPVGSKPAADRSENARELKRPRRAGSPPTSQAHRTLISPPPLRRNCRRRRSIDKPARYPDSVIEIRSIARSCVTGSASRR